MLLSILKENVQANKTEYNVVIQYLRPLSIKFISGDTLQANTQWILICSFYSLKLCLQLPRLNLSNFKNYVIFCSSALPSFASSVIEFRVTETTTFIKSKENRVKSLA